MLQRQAGQEIQRQLAIAAGESSAQIQQATQSVSFFVGEGNEGSEEAPGPNMCQRIVYMSRTHGQLAQVSSRRDKRACMADDFAVFPQEKSFRGVQRLRINLPNMHFAHLCILVPRPETKKLRPWSVHPAGQTSSHIRTHLRVMCGRHSNFYLDRPQLVQVIGELKNTNYRPRTALLGSRQQLCIHPEVRLASRPAIAPLLRAQGLGSRNA
jgi:hypothetical protein